jgi:hypothetical protein
VFSLFRWRSVVWCFGDTLRTAGPINHLGVIGIGISEFFFLKNKIVSLQIWSSYVASSCGVQLCLLLSSE